MNGLTRRSASHRRRVDIDRTAVRYFVYTLADADGKPVYIGRSCNVAARIKAHASGGAEWVTGVRSVSMIGPFTWDDAVREERAAIERSQPRANKALTARDHRPAIAARSTARRSA